MTSLRMFEGIARDFGEFYRDYPGRGGFRGHGVVLDSAADLVPFTTELNEIGLTKVARATPHIDSMGLGIIVAWPEWCFNDDE